jgi:hypothetical protein
MSADPQPVFCSISAASYSLVNRNVAPSMSGMISWPSMRASCCEGSAAKGVAAEPALLGVAQHRLRVVRADEDDVGLAHPVDDRTQLDLAGLGHRARVERGDLVLLGVGGAHEARGVPRLGHVDAGGVDVVALQPGLVVGEVGSDRPDEHRAQAQAPHAEGDVGGDPSPPDLEVLDEEGQGDLVELVRHERVGEPPRERHEVIGRDGTSDEDGHDRRPYRLAPNPSATPASGESWPMDQRSRGLRLTTRGRWRVSCRVRASGRSRRRRRSRSRSGCRS